MPSNYIRHTRVPWNRISRVRQVSWVDPFPGVQGSVPEKMVMAEFVRRGVWFEHTLQANPLPPPVDPTWEPDFLLPQYKIWLEVQGAYFHLMPQAIQSDAWRFAVIESVGWRPIFWWDYDILSRLSDLMNEVPEFYMVTKAINSGGQTNLGNPFWEGGIGIDHLKGLRTANANRARPHELAMRRRPAGKRRPK